VTPNRFYAVDSTNQRVLGFRDSTSLRRTGAGRYRDVLSMKDAGADLIFDFVDVGLPSTVGPADEYREALRNTPDDDDGDGGGGGGSLAAGVVQRGDGDRGDRIQRALQGVMRLRSLRGRGSNQRVPQAARPGTGAAASTEAGIALVEKLCDIKALDLLDKARRPTCARSLIASLAYCRRTFPLSHNFPWDRAGRGEAWYASSSAAHLARSSSD
jgi:hypothetical protein